MTSLLLVIIYLSFISLGLPDSLIGAAWPSMHAELGASMSQAGIVTMIIAAGTVISSLAGDRLTHALGTGKVTAISVGLTALALFGFSTCSSLWQLCLWAIPYGLGAGSVDAALNNYVALHYASRHMSWLHCMWGIGASLGPYIMGAALTGGAGWPTGYRWISYLQIGLTLILIASLPLWRRGRSKDYGEEHAAREASNSANEAIAVSSATRDTISNTGVAVARDKAHTRSTTNTSGIGSDNGSAIAPQGTIQTSGHEPAGTMQGKATEPPASSDKALPLAQVLRIAGVREVMLAFFCYSTVEQTCNLWASSYLVSHVGIDAATAASLAAVFFVGITAGRAASGLLTLRLNDTQLIRLGCALVALGALVVALPLGEPFTLAGLLLIGLGCAPIYPSIIHATPAHFGAERSQAVIGVQMASAYVGTTLMPPLFGLIAEHTSIGLFPVFLAAALALLIVSHERLVKVTS